VPGGVQQLIEKELWVLPCFESYNQDTRVAKTAFVKAAAAY
jgi:hypothetical protein